ncbi:ATP-dependent DNA ligase [Patescibacteria group bacterium]
MKFSDFCGYLEKIEATTLRNEIMEILADLFKKASEDEIQQIVYLSLGRLRPKFDRLEFNLAEKMVVRSIARAFNLPADEVMGVYKEVGDMGDVVKKLMSDLKNSEKGKVSHSVHEVYGSLEKIAKDEGQGSQERKIFMFADLMASTNALEAGYISKIVLGKLRLGFSDKTILDALSFMEHKSKEGRKDLDHAYQVSPDVGNIAKLVKKYGISGVMDRVKISFGVPVVPALAQRLKTADEMVEKMGEVMLEAKYDGTRVQIHWRRESKEEKKSDGLFELENSKDSEVRTFTRNLDENSHMFPELLDISSQMKVDEVILDAEAIGYDPKTGDLLPFQMTITRKRKHGISKAQESVPLKFFVFDVLYVDGKSVIKMPLRERRKLLEEVVGEGEVLVIDDFLVTDNPSKIRNFHKGKLDQGLEGAMVKKIDGPYSPGRTGWNWVKFKEVEEANGKLSDTIDVVVMGYNKGRGKRAAFGIGAFLAGVTMGKSLATVAKVGTGLSDEQWREMKRRVGECEVEKKPKEYGEVDKTLIPDVWVEPKIVVEVAADEITKSPSHSAKKALRFPRLVKFRDDKSVEEITKVEELDSI